VIAPADKKDLLHSKKNGDGMCVCAHICARSPVCADVHACTHFRFGLDVFVEMPACVLELCRTVKQVAFRPFSPRALADFWTRERKRARACVHAPCPLLRFSHGRCAGYVDSDAKIQKILAGIKGSL